MIETKDDAIVFLLKVLRSPMSMTAKPTREQAFDLAEKHQVSAADLLNRLQEIVWKI